MKSESRKKSISTAKSFSQPLSRLDEIQAVLAAYAASCAEELREDKQVASFISVWLEPNSSYGGAFQTFASFVFQEPTAFTPEIVQEAKKILQAIFKEGVYRKVGILLGGLFSDVAIQQDLFSLPKEHRQHEKKLMNLIDDLNSNYGKKAIRFAGELSKKEKRKSSPRYTTDWNDILKIEYNSSNYDN